MLGHNRQGGFSLIELMITVVISMLVVLGGINMYIAILGSTQDTYQRNRLTEEVRVLGVVISKELRRAGFWNADMGTDDIWDNPFTAAATNINVSAMAGQTASSCVTYTYDINKDGAVSANEYFAIRLNAGAAQLASDATDCDTGTFSTLTTPEISIEALGFTLREACLNVGTEAIEACPCASGGSCQHVRSIDLTISAALTADSDVTEVLLDTIKIRNDKFVLSVP